MAYGIANVVTQKYTKGQKTVFVLISFSVLYALLTAAILPQVAPIFGRTALNCFSDGKHPYQASSWLYCALNRHYVRPELKKSLERLSQHMSQKYPGTISTYLDANFPFIDGFPLLPHRSHNDGKKLDINFFYKDKASGKPLPKGGAWFVGYWSFEPAWRHQKNKGCKIDGILRWRMEWIQFLFKDVEFDMQRTAEAVRYLAQRDPSIQKVLIEPYLLGLLNVQGEKIRFAGCNAARHDDHIHYQIY